MRFGPVPVEAAEGATLAHAQEIPGGGVLRKGHRLAAADCARLAAGGIGSVVVARLDPGDVGEDEAARRVAEALAGNAVRVEAPATGRSNLFAREAGVLTVDRAAIDALNRVDPGITVATLPAFEPVEAGRMVATVKIIPFAVSAAAVERALAAVAAHGPILRVAPFRPLKVAVVSTLLPTLKGSVVDKTLAVLAGRLAPAGARIVADLRVPHREEAVAEAIGRAAADGAEMTVVFGASAVVDRRDVVPAALDRAGGEVVHLGMPVDPGNLLMIGRLGAMDVLGAPGCARSPKENGFDWVLTRRLADLPVTPEDVMGMGVGGLMMEIVSRPAPREGADRAGATAALVLAAGRSTRMGGPNKLLATLDGVPLVRRVVEAALASRASGVTVVTGHMAAEVRAALAGLDVAFADNPAYAEGLSTSLRSGLAALPDDVGAAVVLLGDMPMVSAATMDRLIAALDPAAGQGIVVPTFEGKRGNPVVWARRFFPELARVHGDVGARHVIGEHAAEVVEVEIGAEVTLDLDTPEALAAAGGRLSG